MLLSESDNHTTLKSAPQRQQGPGGGWVPRLRTGGNPWCGVSGLTILGFVGTLKYLRGSTAKDAKDIGLRCHGGARARAVVSQSIGKPLPLTGGQKHTHTFDGHCLKQLFGIPHPLQPFTAINIGSTSSGGVPSTYSVGGTLRISSSPQNPCSPTPTTNSDPIQPTSPLSSHWPMAWTSGSQQSPETNFH